MVRAKSLMPALVWGLRDRLREFDRQRLNHDRWDGHHPLRPTLEIKIITGLIPFNLEIPYRSKSLGCTSQFLKFWWLIVSHLRSKDYSLADGPVSVA